MNQKLVIGGVVLLLVIGGGLFLLLGGIAEPKPGLGESGSDTIPTQWSQAGDYNIEETSEGTIVTNSKAGFSFKVPVGWSVETQSFDGEEFILEFLSSDAVKQEGNPPLVKGCGIGLNVFYQELDWAYYNGLIQRFLEDSDSGRVGEEVIEVGGIPAFKNAVNVNDSVAIARFGEVIQVHVPISNNGVIEFGTTMMSNRQSDCEAEFDTFISSFSVK